MSKLTVVLLWIALSVVGLAWAADEGLWFATLLFILQIFVGSGLAPFWLAKDYKD